jgi:hypothetical protein
MFVGIDPRRLNYGGPTSNASSFFDKGGLEWNRDFSISVRLRAARIFREEYQAFLKPVRLAEYLFNHESIHAGSYVGSGLYSFTGTHGGNDRHTSGLKVPLGSCIDDVLELKGPLFKRASPRVSQILVNAFEKNNIKLLRRKKISPNQLEDLKRKMEENGRLGEEHVLNEERKGLRYKGRSDLAARVRWVSQRSVCEGFDILSYEFDGREKWIEVKSTSGTGRTFDMSKNEWDTCCRAGAKYYIYRVTNVRRHPEIKKYKNPQLLEAKGLISKSVSGWRITLL